MSDRVPNGVVRVECGVELQLTPMARRAGACEEFHQAVVYGVHTHNMNTDPESGDFVALALPSHDLEAIGPEQVGEVLTVFGSAAALDRFVTDTPQIDKAVRRRIVMHGAVQPALELCKGTAYIRYRKNDRANFLRKTDPKAASQVARNIEKHISIGQMKFPLRILPCAGETVQTGRVNTYGLSSKKAPVFL